MSPWANSNHMRSLLKISCAATTPVACTENLIPLRRSANRVSLSGAWATLVHCGHLDLAVQIGRAAGAKAIATSSWSVAEAQGYRDGEAIPRALVESIVERITHTINAPVTVDFEGGYGEDGKTLADNVSRLIDLGVVGIKFEDRVVQGKGLYTMDRQAKRISALRNAAEKSGVPVFINARSDVFFESDDHAKSIDQALVRANAYHAAGASGFFVPGLVDRALIKQVCEGVSLPVNGWSWKACRRKRSSRRSESPASATVRFHTSRR